MKNALQAQLLKAGLVDKNKAKKLNKQSAHAKRTGDPSTDEAKKAVAEAKAKKQEKDQKLNQEKQQLLEQRTLKANVIQMIKQHQITDKEDTSGTDDVEYKFVDNSKIKKIYLSKKTYEQIVAGHLVLARLDVALEDTDPDDDYQGGYALLPYPLAERINDRIDGFIITTKKDDSSINSDVSDEEDPYAAYVIPDDLMW